MLQINRDIKNLNFICFLIATVILIVAFLKSSHVEVFKTKFKISVNYCELSILKIQLLTTIKETAHEALHRNRRNPNPQQPISLHAARAEQVQLYFLQIRVPWW